MSIRTLFKTVFGGLALILAIVVMAVIVVYLVPVIIAYAVIGGIILALVFLCIVCRLFLDEFSPPPFIRLAR